MLFFYLNLFLFILYNCQVFRRVSVYLNIYILVLYILLFCSLWVRIPLRQGVLDTTLCDQVCQWLAVGLWFSPGTLVSSTNKTDRHNITDILLKVALNTIILHLFLLAWALPVHSLSKAKNHSHASSFV
jgi:hypothetical protein